MRTSARFAGTDAVAVAGTDADAGTDAVAVADIGALAVAGDDTVSPSAVTGGVVASTAARAMSFGAFSRSCRSATFATGDAATVDAAGVAVAGAGAAAEGVVSGAVARASSSDPACHAYHRSESCSVAATAIASADVSVTPR